MLICGVHATNFYFLLRDFLGVLRGQNLAPQWNLGDFFHNFEQKSQFTKKNIFFWGGGGGGGRGRGRGRISFSHNTHKLHGDNLRPLNLISPSIF